MAAELTEAALVLYGAAGLATVVLVANGARRDGWRAAWTNVAETVDLEIDDDDYLLLGLVVGIGLLLGFLFWPLLVESNIRRRGP